MKQLQLHAQQSNYVQLFVAVNTLFARRNNYVQLFVTVNTLFARRNIAQYILASHLHSAECKHDDVALYIAEYIYMYICTPG